MASTGGLSEAAPLWWRKRPSDRTLRRDGRLWTAWTAVVSTPFFAAGGFLLWLEPLTFPVALASFAHGWVIPELYARRGAGSVVPIGSRASAARRADRSEDAERAALGLLGDLIRHEQRDLAARTGLVLMRGRRYPRIRERATSARVARSRSSPAPAAVRPRGDQGARPGPHAPLGPRRPPRQPRSAAPARDRARGRARPRLVGAGGRRDADRARRPRRLPGDGRRVDRGRRGAPAGVPRDRAARRSRDRRDAARVDPRPTYRI